MLEGTRSGLLALKPSPRPRGPPGARGPAAHPRRRRGGTTGRGCMAQGEPDGPVLLDLLRAYGIAAARACPARTAPTARWRRRPRSGTRWCSRPASPASPTSRTRAGSCSACGDPAGARPPPMPEIWPSGWAAGCSSARPIRTAAPSSPLGIARDHEPRARWWWSGRAAVLVEFLADRAVALPPVNAARALSHAGPRCAWPGCSPGYAASQPRTPDAIAGAVVGGLPAIARELGDELEALDINPLICGPGPRGPRWMPWPSRARAPPHRPACWISRGS